MAKQMAKTVGDNLRKDVAAHFGALVAKADKENVRSKLRNLHRTCAHVVDKAPAALSVPLVVTTYAKLCGDTIGESTIRNKMSGANPYQSLYRRWELVAAAEAAAIKPRSVLDAGMLGENDVLAIEDPGLRHRVTLIATQNRSLHSELNILRSDLAKMPLRIEGASLVPGGADLLLSDDELDAVRDFIDPRRMNAKSLQRTTDDGVKLKDGRPIADPGFLSALEKIVKSYERP
ncbi:hypothetical protein ABIF69_003268 [Bradyrhizobium japonicum]